MIQKSILQGLGIALLVLASCGENEMKPKPPKLPESFKRIQDKSIEDSTLVKLVKNLDTSFHEPKSFWEKIINDTNYSIIHRRICAVKLVERFVRKGMLLRNFPRLFPVSDTATLSNRFVGERDTVYRRRIARSGGSWKDVAYYLQSGRRVYDTLENQFKMRMLRAGYRLFYVDLDIYKEYDFSCDIFNIGFYIALKGEMNEDCLRNFLVEQNGCVIKEQVIEGIYPVLEMEVNSTRTNEN